MKHTNALAAALAVAACGSTTGPHAPYMLIVTRWQRRPSQAS